MSVSIRSYLMAGAAAATATAVALTPIQVVPADVAVPAHPTSVQPHLTEAMVKLLAAASNITPPAPPTLPGAGVVPKVGPNPLAAAHLASAPVVGVQNAASDWLTNAYVNIQAWVDWGVDYATDVMYWLGWFVPFSGTIAAQTDIFYYTLIRPISDNIFYGAVVPIVNNPLNLGVWANGIWNAARWSVSDVVNFGIAEFNYFFGWLIPPIPPLPPIGPLAATQPPNLAAAVKTALTNLASALNPAKAPAKSDPTAKIAPTAALTEKPAETPTKADENGKTDEKGAATEAEQQPTSPNADEPKTETKPDPKAETKGDEPKTDPKAGAPAAGETEGPAADPQDEVKAPKPVKKPGKKAGTKNAEDNQATDATGTTDTKPGKPRGGKATKNEKGTKAQTGAGQNSGADNHAAQG